MTQPDDALVATAAGVVRGSTTGGIHVFKGIPYAAPPVGKRRYRKPIPPASWDGIRPCLEPGPASLQPDGGTGGMAARYRVREGKHEDCLFLNVWTPGLHGAERPVVVFVHGGAYMSGSGAVELYDGTRYAGGGAVFVTCNYRLGGLGFMHLDDYFPGLESSGNLGILDVVRTLEWVQENIAAFGGDPGNVTLAGSSSGAITTAALLASPLGRGLFRRAVLMSSAAGHTTLDPDTAGRIGRRYLDHIGIAPGDLASLEAIPAERTVIPYGSVWTDMVRIADWHPLCPVSDGHVLTGPVIDLVARGAGAEVDVLAGSTTDEQRSAFVAEGRLDPPHPCGQDDLLDEDMGTVVRALGPSLRRRAAYLRTVGCRQGMEVHRRRVRLGGEFRLRDDHSHRSIRRCPQFGRRMVLPVQVRLAVPADGWVPRIVPRIGNAVLFRQPGPSRVGGCAGPRATDETQQRIPGVGDRIRHRRKTPMSGPCRPGPCIRPSRDRRWSWTTRRGS